MMQWGDPRLPLAFWRRCIPEPNTGCWLMLGREVPGGYLQFGADETLCHRLTWEIEHGALPEFDRHRSRVDVELDHRCNTPCCANPDHARPSTSRENNLRSGNACAEHARRESCPQGHPYDETNTIVRIDRKGRKHRSCRTCAVACNARHYRARKARRTSASLQPCP
jgi:hypothetical protein